MNYIGFSLWGDNPIYTIGAIKNAKLIKQIYPGWKMVLYYNNTVPIKIITELNYLDVITIDMSNSNLYGMFWRFLVNDIPDCEYSIFRDADSRVSLREAMAVHEWVNSKKIIHVMRDHTAHIIPYGNTKPGILGGLWGLRSKIVNIGDMLREYGKENEKIYGNDQTFLILVYDKFKDNMCIHDEIIEKKPFPIGREGNRFVGERIDENDIPIK